MSREQQTALEAEIGTLAREIKAFQDAYTGDKAAPRDELNAMLQKADRIDAAKAELKEITADEEKMARLGRAYESTRESAGHAPLVTTIGQNENVGIGEARDGWFGVRDEKRGFVPLWQKHYFDGKPELKASATPEYKAAFLRYLRGEEKLLTGEEHQTLVKGAKALSESSNVGGGFAVPVDFLPELIMRLPGPTTFNAKARHITTNRDVVQAPRIAANTGSYPTMFSSAVVSTWVSENPSATTGQVAPVFESMPITVNTAKLETVLSKNLVADAAFNVGSYLSEEFARAANLERDKVCLIGTGLAQPLGVNADTTITQQKTGSNTALSVDDPKNLIYNTPVQYWPNAEFWLSLAALRTYRTMKDGNGNYIWSPGFNHGFDGGVPDTLEGKPYNVTDFLPGVAQNNVPMIFGNPQFYWVIDRLDMSIQVLTELYAESNQIAYLAFFRMGGHVVVPQAFQQLLVSS